ncbi:MAG: beta-lactamase family protein [Streptosporangiaceae bacterium]|nr:beta-lactamase family protein [Streptosporangiaceae bacterium]MBV9854042.1 beta-lactamase family protein [Streptosporangiaceae bacterium]
MITRRHLLGAGAAAAAGSALRLPGSAATPQDPYARRQLQAITGQDVPGALAVIRTGTIQGWAAAGTADLETGRPPQRNDRFRIASITKTFVATVVLQLAAEGRIGLDDPVSRYLPGLLPYSSAIRIRDLLQHTSGLPDYHDYDGLDSAAAYLARRYDNPAPYQSIALATAHPLLFTPGTAWSYADTNYLVLGLAVQRVTGMPIAAEVTRRLIRPLGLTATSFPMGTAQICGTHLHGYMPADLPGRPFANITRPIDFTRETIDQTGAAGAMISNGPDLLRFLRALLRGSLLPADLMKEMTRTVSTGSAAAGSGMTGYGLGLAQFGTGSGTFWGNTGVIHGYVSALVATRDGSRQLAATATLSPVPNHTAATIATAYAAIARSLNHRHP